MLYTITDSSGRTIQSGIYDNEIINIKNLASGVYYINLSFNSGKIFSEKFVKNQLKFFNGKVSADRLNILIDHIMDFTENRIGYQTNQK